MIVGVDIGGTKIAAAGFVETRGDLRMVAQPRTVPTPAAAGGAEVVRVVRELVAELSAGLDLLAVGVGTAGVVSADGVITSATDAISGWAGFPLRASLADAFGPGIHIGVLNDVHAVAIAEAEHGAGVHSDSVLVAAVGTGIGGAVVLAGELRRGVTGTAGSLGHVEVAARDALAARRCPCGGRGHVEAMASGPAMEQTYLEQTGERATLREIDQRAQRGEQNARDVIAEGARLLGRALASANALLDAEVIVIGGGVAEIGERYLADVESAYRDASMPGPGRARLIGAHHRVDAAVTGAALSVR